MISALRQLFLLAASMALGFALFVIFFWAGVGSSVTILFYRGVLLAIAASVLTGFAALLLARRTSDWSLPIAAAALSLSFNLCFLVLLPVTIDRSVTVYLLSTIDRQGGVGINPGSLQHAFIDDYVIRMGAIGRRIHEQSETGNVVVTPDGKVHLTKQGERFMAFSRLVAQLFGTDPRFVGREAPSTNDASVKKMPPPAGG